MEYTPYTYYLCWSELDRHYYGVRYRKGCGPTDLWNPYKTSSKEVKKFIEENGDPDIIQIRKTFSDREAATQWEQKVLRRLKVNIKENWINKTYNGCFTFRGPKNTRPGWEASKLKTTGVPRPEYLKKQWSEKQKGIPKSEEHKRNLRKPKSVGHTEEWKKEHSKKVSGKKNGMYGRKHTPESIAKGKITRRERWLAKSNVALTKRI